MDYRNAFDMQLGIHPTWSGPLNPSLPLDKRVENQLPSTSWTLVLFVSTCNASETARPGPVGGQPVVREASPQQ
jgi:hypothetical protein